MRFFFCNDTATTEIYTLSLHDALPILQPAAGARRRDVDVATFVAPRRPDQLAVLIDQSPPGKLADFGGRVRSEEHTSELQSHVNLVCRLLLEKKKQTNSMSKQSRIYQP